MQFKKVVLASFLALSLVACGDNDDKSKPDDDNKTKEPPKTEECIKAGDKCVLEDGKWVIKKEDEEPAPEVDTDFDYSNIGVTDKLEPVRRGFGFYHKGMKSPLDAKRFSKNKPTLSPSVSWSSSLDYDVDLWNFVAITPHNDENNNSTKGQKKYMFDKIGEHNHTQNKNIDFFGKTAVAAAGSIGKSSYDSSAGYAWNMVPAVVNTYIHKKTDGTFYRQYADKNKRIWYYDEADDRTIGSGTQSSRVYGVNAFLESTTAADIIKTDKTVNTGTPAETYELVNRDKAYSGKVYFKHANFAYWKPTDRKGKAIWDGTSLKAAKEVYGGTDPKLFPTDLHLGELKYAQFGRVSGAGVNANAPSMPDYSDSKLREYDFFKAGETTAAAGSKRAEDWYFARGTIPTTIEKLEEIKNGADEDQVIIYDGQALMFGLDYDPVKKMSSDGSKPSADISTNAVKPSGNKAHVDTLLDGKQNLVRIQWEPSSGKIDGGVFGIWTQVSYWLSLKDYTADGGPDVGQIVQLGHDGYDVVPDFSKSGVAFPGDHTGASAFIDNATRINYYQNNLVELRGSVIEGTNSFGGVATKCNNQCDKDNVQLQKGVFVGAFFGPKADEIAGVINSQTGSMKDPELSDPDAKWGGSFGAQQMKEADKTREYLDFPHDEDFDYNATFERY